MRYTAEHVVLKHMHRDRDDTDYEVKWLDPTGGLVRAHRALEWPPDASVDAPMKNPCRLAGLQCACPCGPWLTAVAKM